MNGGIRWTRAHLGILQLAFNQCLQCKRSDETLEFAHLSPTGVRKKGRGRTDRTIDVLRHLGSYTRLCRACHTEYDAGAFGAWSPPSLLEVALDAR